MFFAYFYPLDGVLYFFFSLQTLATSGSSTDENNTGIDDLELIQHINLNRHLLVRLLLEATLHMRSLRKSVQMVLVANLEKAIWNWMEQYPEEFVNHHHSPDPELSSNCKKLFDILEPLFDNNKKKAVVWPLQTLLLTLCPDVLNEISGSEPPTDHTHFRKVKLIHF